MPAASAAAVNRRPMARGVRGTTRSLGSGVVAVRSERKASATPAFTNRTSVVSPAGFVFEVRTRMRTPATAAPHVELTEGTGVGPTGVRTDGGSNQVAGGAGAVV